MNLIAGVILAILAVIDYKKKKIPVWPVLLMGGGLLFIRILTGGEADGIICSLLPGILFLIIAFATKEKIGAGDGIVLLCLGMGYDLEILLVILGVSFTAAAVVSAGLLFLKRANRKTELPFLPFLFLGWIIGIW